MILPLDSSASIKMGLSANKDQTPDKPALEAFEKAIL